MKQSEKLSFAVLRKAFLGTNLYKCILCSNTLLFARALAKHMRENCYQKGHREWRRKRWLRMSMLEYNT